MQQGADIKGYFDNIPHDQLMDRVRDKISDSRVLGLLEKMLRQGVMATTQGWTPTEQGTHPACFSIPGNVTEPTGMSSGESALATPLFRPSASRRQEYCPVRNE